MSGSKKPEKKIVKKELLLREIPEILDRINELELGNIGAVEFSYLTSEAFELLQTQINVLKGVLNTLSVNLGGEELFIKPVEQNVDKSYFPMEYS